MTNFQKITKVLFVTIVVLMFGLLFFYVNIQQERYRYLIYFFGDSVYPGARVLARAVSEDGEIVTDPELFVNGRPLDSNILELYPDLREVKVKDDRFETVFPIRYKDIADFSIRVRPLIQFFNDELSTIPSVPRAGNRSIFLLPDSFRIVPEFETTVHLFCLSDGKPCKESSIFINDAEKKLRNGYTAYHTVLQADNRVNIQFNDGSSVVTAYPFYGKQFRISEEEGRITLSSLIDARNMHVDCYRSGKWKKTDVISVNSSGILLPGDYINCDRIQASFNSNYPGRTFAVLSRNTTLEAEVSDPYYSRLSRHIHLFDDHAQTKFVQSYNASFFIPLSLVFSGNVLQKRFLEQKQKKLNFIWWSIFFVSMLSLLLFIAVMFSKFKVVEGLDGELITHSKNRQRALFAFAVIFYTVVVVMLLYLLLNLA